MDRLLSMRVFQKVIDEGGFAAAARALEMAPAGVTRLVTDLEQHLGARLMQRTTRKLLLTDAGEAYLLRVRAILAEVDDAEACASQSASALKGVVHVLAPPLFANRFFAYQIKHWHSRYPNVCVDMQIDPFPQPRVEEFDVTFLTVAEGTDLNIVARKIASTQWIVCASPSYLKRYGTPKQPADLERHLYLSFPWHVVASAQAHRGLRLSPLSGEGEAVDAPIQTILHSPSLDMLFNAAIDGAGIAVMPKFPSENYLSTGALVHILPDWIFGDFALYAALPTRKLIPARTRAFLDFATEMSFKPIDSTLSVIKAA